MKQEIELFLLLDQTNQKNSNKEYIGIFNSTTRNRRRQENSPHSIDIVVYGDDHGQGKFRAILKIIFCDIHKTNLDSIVLKVGHIDCKKDTYGIIRDKISTKTNQSLNILNTSGGLIIKHTTINGTDSVIAELKQTNYVIDNTDIDGPL